MSKSLEERLDDLALTVRDLTAEVTRLKLRVDAPRPGDLVRVVSLDGNYTQENTSPKWLGRSGHVEEVDYDEMTARCLGVWLNISDLVIVGVS